MSGPAFHVGVAPALLSLLLFVAGCTPAPPELPPLPVGRGGVPVSFREQVQPVLEERCVVCHGCNDAPCQLQLGSFAGLDRGASHANVYHSERLVEAPPSRLLIDARSTSEWRERGFFPVLETASTADARPLLLGLLALGRNRAFAADEPLPAAVELDITRELTCPAPAELGSYVKKNPLGGMPYATAPITDAELGVIAAWVAQGSPGPSPGPPLPAAARAQVAAWEDFLNGGALKERVTSRYLYEHWFFAHLYFSDLPAGPFFRVVRSRTASPAPVDEIATRRPYDSPGSDPFWYRLVSIEEAIVRKSHLTYRLSPARMVRLEALFLAPGWQPTRFPSYETEDASNPFVSFDEIPARSRYQYMLDDARYFISSFIRGPVCRGQVAVDVIQDHFFVAFVDPDHDFASTDASFLAETKQFLNLPSEQGSGFEAGGLWLEYARQQDRYLEVLANTFAERDPQGLGPGLDFIWDGDGHDPDALLTVFRNFDSAVVVHGFHGGIPKTAWVIDFPIFERIYYNLVAGFDVFGNLTHQLATRLYMDHLRMQSENLFLAFLPEATRAPLRESWYQGATDSLNYRHVDRMRSGGHGTQIRFSGADPKRELIEMLLARSSRVSGPPDLINRCAGRECDRPGASPIEKRTERALRPLASVRGKWVRHLPEVTFLRVLEAEATGASATYTLLHNRAHTNVASAFGEDDRLVPADDTLTIVRGLIGSYPNFVFDVALADVENFAASLASVDDGASLDELVRRWGVRRTSPRFWPTLDWLHEELRRQNPTEAGILDINRYKNL